MSDRQENILDQMMHTGNQERWAINRVTAVFQNAGILPNAGGLSKREGMDLNRANGAKQSHEVHKNTQLSWKSYANYKSSCVPLAVMAKQEGTWDIYKITPQNVANYLQFAMDCEVKASTYDDICSAIEKFCTAINEHNGTNVDFHSIISEYRHEGKETLPLSDYTTRAYADPQAIIDNLPNEKMQIAAELQVTCGLRVADACYITSDMVKGLDVTVHSKNGQHITVTLSPKLSERLNAIIKAEGKFSVNVRQYDYRLEKACEMTGQAFFGSHGFRHWYAQSRMAELTGEGLSYQRALLIVSEEMGHHRPDITELYLRP